MLLVFIHSLKQLTLSPWSQDDPRRMVMNEIKVDALVKSLVKPLRQACYGGSASGWAPILLPIVASVPNQFTVQVLVVKNLVRALAKALSSFFVGDTGLIVISVCFIGTTVGGSFMYSGACG
jgi:hypothetical protein